MRVGDKFCPGILHAVPAKDGLLTRIRVPGGLISSRQLSTIAELSTFLADGQVEITSRANIQLRAIRQESLPHLVNTLSSVGLLPSFQHDRVRNIVTSPFAGHDSEELVDTRSLVRKLDNRLTADPLLADLPPKFCFALDGGDKRFSPAIDDLALRVVDLNHSKYFHLMLGGIPLDMGVPADDADNIVTCVLEAARLCLRIANDFNLPARGRGIASEPQAMSSFKAGLADLLVPCPRPKDADIVAETPVGVHQTKRAGFVCVIPSVPLGRLRDGQIRCIVETAERWNGDLRLAPWRGIIMHDIPVTALSDVATRFESVGLSYDGKDGYRGIAACAGITGCDASMADVRRDAALLAQNLYGLDAKPGWRVNISGCDKQCAMRNGATVELVANQAGYSIKVNGRLIDSVCSAESAITAVMTHHARLTQEGSS
jgi:precorrin-3B synthase